MAFCGQCGARLEEDVKFCTQCGAAVAGAQGGAPSGDSAPSSESTTAASTTPGQVTLTTWKNVPPAEATKTIPVTPVEALGTAPAAEAAASTGEAVPKSGASASASRSQQPQQPQHPQGKSKLPLIVGIIVAIALIALVALYVVPLFISHPHDPNEDVALIDGVVVDNGGGKTDGVVEGEGNDSSSKEGGAESKDSSKPSSITDSDGSGKSTSDGTTTDESAQPGSTSGGATDGGGTPGSSSTPGSSNTPGSSSTPGTSGGTTDGSGTTGSTTNPERYSTHDLPQLGEFMWLDGETMKGNVPAGATRILDFGALMGGWKAYMFGGRYDRLFTAEIDAGQNGAAITLDWAYVHNLDTDEGYDDTTPDSVFVGEFDGGMLDATGSGRITIAAFWEKDGHQYAVGSFMWPDGEINTIALVRP